MNRFQEFEKKLLQTVPTVPTSRSARVLVTMCGSGAALILCTSCIYLHNEPAAKKSEALLTQFKAYQTNSGGVYDTMLDNLARLEEKGAQRLTRDAELKANAFAAALPLKTLGDIQGELSAASQTNSILSHDLEKSITATANEKLKSEQRLGDSNGALVQIKKELQSAQDEAKKWEARQMLFRGVLEFYTGNATNIAKLDKALLQNAKANIWEQKVGSTTVGEILKDDFKDLKSLDIGETAKGYTIDLFDPAKAPGITVKILSFGEDLAVVQTEKAKLDVDRLKDLQSNFEQRKVVLGEMVGYAKQASNMLAAVLNMKLSSGAKITPDQTVLQLVQNLKSDKDQTDLTAFLTMLLQYSIVRTLDESILRDLSTKPAIMEHEYSIRLSRFNAHEREALISRGLESLVQYYEGGIKPEDLANLARAVEAAGVAVIGAKID